jgi:hypothetical protein
MTENEKRPQKHLGCFRKISDAQVKTDEAVLRCLLRGRCGLPEVARRTKQGTADGRKESLDRLGTWGLVEIFESRLDGETYALTETGKVHACDLEGDDQVARYDAAEAERPRP